MSTISTSIPGRARETSAPSTSKGLRVTGYILTGLITAFMLLDGVLKLMKIQPVIDGTVRLGYPESSIRIIGAAALVGAILYAIPQTTVIGAIVLTGFLGGAVATHLRAGEPLFNCTFPVLFGVIAWLGVYCRDARIRQLLPLRRGL